MLSTDSSSRITAIDTLRGFVMALMLVDHVREYFYLHLQVPDPMLISSTPPELFFTRLTSHFCAPIFVLLTGLGAWLYGNKAGRSRADVSAYLFKRGLFLVALELTVINFAWSFAFPPSILYLQVIWAIGLSMVALAALLWLPYPAQIACALLIICGHNTLDVIQFQAGEWGFIPWAILHDRSVIEVSATLKLRTSYPVLPWVGVILLGYALGPLYRSSIAAHYRQRWLTRIGAGMLMVFFALRSWNVYGDHPRAQDGAALEWVMSYLNVTKYPPSLLFLALTLGVGLILLAWFERKQPLQPLLQLGRVPMFFYTLHLYALHCLYLVFNALYGANQGSRFGFAEVWQLWLCAIVLLCILYFPCRWFAQYKQRSRAPWTSYF